MVKSSFVSVAVPVPFLDQLTYRVPEDLERPVRGARVIVPLGARHVTGIVTVVDASPGTAGVTTIRNVVDVLDREPFLPAPVLDLALWVAEYYACGAGDAIRSAMPPHSARASAHKTVPRAAITAQGRAATEGVVSPPLGDKQREALAVLSGAPGGMTLSALRDRGIGRATVMRLSRRQFVAVRRERIERDPFIGLQRHVASIAGERGARTLTPEQSAALGRLTELATTGLFRVALLHGVTASGKTELYVRLARLARDRGRSVLVLVPEIALTPAVATVFRASFADQVAIQHSGLSDGERYDQWQRIRRGDVSIVVGTRSAVFAPLAKLGLIVVDEEHDASFKQEESPRYHGRDVAIMRAKQTGALVVLGSATPAVETYQNALIGRYERIRLGRRIFERPLASVRVVSMREEYAEGGPDVILSEPLKAAIEERLQRGEQSLVLLNRRGLATAVFCRQCARTLECPNCSVSLAVHTERGGLHRARCHYCNYSLFVPSSCPHCAGPYLERAGFGTERVEAEINALWPRTRVARLDRDTARPRGAVPALLARVARGEVDVLVGTQMIAKGHDFPRVTLVGVISADVGLGLADFRAAERTFQLLTQVAGRAGRGEMAGEAVIQTLYPDHYSIQHACRQDYEAFFADEIRYRRAMRYPPIVALVNAIVRAPTFAQAFQDASEVAAELRHAGHGRYRVLGPAPAPLGRLRGEYRVQLFLKGARRAAMREALLAALRSRKQLRKRVTVDVDPLSVL